MKRLLLSAAAIAALTLPASAWDAELPIVCNQSPDPGPPPGTVSPRVAKAYKRPAANAVDVTKFCEEQKRQLAEKRERERQAAEAQRAAMAEQAKRLAEQQARFAEEARLAEIEARKPINRLYRAYSLFARVDFCRQVREGFVVVWINGPEYERSYAAVKAVESKAMAEQPELNSDDVWQKAVQAMKSSNWLANSYTCGDAREALYRMSPVNVYQFHKP
jgi:hypothetical protein